MNPFDAKVNAEIKKLGGHDLARERITKVQEFLNNRVGHEHAKALMQGIWTAYALKGFENLLARTAPDWLPPEHAPPTEYDALTEYASKSLMRSIEARSIVARDPPDFYQSSRWRRLRYQALKANGSTCQCCGEPAKPPHVDHIKPRSKYPKLEYEISNLQVLCRWCNSIKSDNDETDWR